MMNLTESMMPMSIMNTTLNGMAAVGNATARTAGGLVCKVGSSALNATADVAKGAVVNATKFALGINNMENACRALTNSTVYKKQMIDGIEYHTQMNVSFVDRASFAMQQTWNATGKLLFCAALPTGLVSKVGTNLGWLEPAQGLSLRNLSEGTLTVTKETVSLAVNATIDAASYTVEKAWEHPTIANVVVGTIVGVGLVISAVKDFTSVPTVKVKATGHKVVVESESWLKHKAQDCAMGVAKLAGAYLIANKLIG